MAVDDRCQLVIKSLENSIQLICVGEVMKLTKGIMGMPKERTRDMKRGEILTAMMIFVVGRLAYASDHGIWSVGGLPVFGIFGIILLCSFCIVTEM